MSDSNADWSASRQEGAVNGNSAYPEEKAANGDWPRSGGGGRSPSPGGGGGGGGGGRRRSRSPMRVDNDDRHGSRGADMSTNPGNNLHVSGLSTRTEERDLEEVFSKFGRVQKVQVMRDPHTKESRGFAFVTMESAPEGDEAKAGMNATDVMGKIITVEKARRGRARTPTPGQYRGPPKRDTSYRPYEPRGRYDDRYDRYDRYDSYDRREYSKPLKTGGPVEPTVRSSGAGRATYDDRYGYAIPMRGNERSSRYDDDDRYYRDRRDRYRDRR